jgi:type I site-specific restriction endonuclease
MGTKKNKATRQNGNRKLVGAIRKHLTESVTLEGVKYTPARLAKMFQDGIDIADATDAASKAWHAAVATEKAKTQELSGVQASLRDHVSATFGAASTEFADFGFTPKAVRAVDAKTKAAAVEKRAATRKARNTMGKRERLKVTGATAAAAVSAAPAATPVAPAAPEAAAPAPVLVPPAASQANGAPVAAKIVASA